MKIATFYLPVAVYFMAAASLSGCESDNLINVTIHRVSPEGIGESIGTVKIAETPAGLQFTPDLHDLTPGEHGFHVHENPSCDPGMKDGSSMAALSAGGHYDPDNTGRHAGPKGDGHKGDLPVLTVDENGNAQMSVVARRLKLSEVKGHSLMIHAGGDNYSDDPPMGGGGARIACGVIQ